MSDKVVKLPNQPNHLASLPTLHFNSLPARYNKKIGFGNFSKTRPIYIQVQSQTEIEAEAKKEQNTTKLILCQHITGKCTLSVLLNS